MGQKSTLPTRCVYVRCWASRCHVNELTLRDGAETTARDIGRNTLKQSSADGKNPKFVWRLAERPGEREYSRQIGTHPRIPGRDNGELHEIDIVACPLIMFTLAAAAQMPNMPNMPNGGNMPAAPGGPSIPGTGQTSNPIDEAKTEAECKILTNATKPECLKLMLKK